MSSICILKDSRATKRLMILMHYLVFTIQACSLSFFYENGKSYIFAEINGNAKKIYSVLKYGNLLTMVHTFD